MIQRIFHPIGQGAFYSERHEGLNIVYDCGELKDTKKADGVVKQSFREEDTIDILFISHFDFDHVSKIKILKENFKISKVVLPLLHENEIVFLRQFYSSIGLSEVNSLISEPKEYFGESSQIIKIKAVQGGENPNNERETIDLENLVDSELDSGTILKQKDWVFIPYNYRYNQRKIKIEKLFNENKLDIEEFKNSIDYALFHRKLIKKIYEKVEGGINENSMILYSGPVDNSHFQTLNFQETLHNPHVLIPRVGCIYTGDADLKYTDLYKTYKQFWDYVGTIQIPHHGSIHSFDYNIFKYGKYLCPISFGINNTFGHPSSIVINDILRYDCIPIFITEHPESIFVQLFT